MKILKQITNYEFEYIQDTTQLEIWKKLKGKQDLHIGKRY